MAFLDPFLKQKSRNAPERGVTADEHYRAPAALLSTPILGRSFRLIALRRAGLGSPEVEWEGLMGAVYVVGTLDTKGDEHRYVRDLIEAAGASTTLVDVGTTGTGEGADISAEAVAALHPDGADAVFVDDRGRAVVAMSEALVEAYTNARANLAALCDEAASSREPVIIHRRGAEDVALISAAELRSLVETAHLLRSPENARRLLEALGRALKGDYPTESVAKLRRELGLEDQTK